MLTPRAAILYQIHSIARLIKGGSLGRALLELQQLEQTLIEKFDRDLGIYPNQGGVKRCQN